MSTERRRSIYLDSIHFLDFADSPQWVNTLFQEQLNDPEVIRLSESLLRKMNKGDGAFSKLRKIQQYLHDQTYHINQFDRQKLFGYLAFSDIPYAETLIVQAFHTITFAMDIHQIPSVRNTWVSDLATRQCVGSKNKGLSRSMEDSEMFRGKAPLQCVEEATLAAALACHIGAIIEDQVVFLVSPAHVMFFVRPVQHLPKGALFDSKMLYQSKDMKKFCNNPDVGLNRMLDRLGGLWSIVTPGGFFNIHNPVIEKSPIEVQIWKELNDFFK